KGAAQSDPNDNLPTITQETPEGYTLYSENGKMVISQEELSAYRNLYGVSSDIPDASVLYTIYSELHPEFYIFYPDETGTIIGGDELSAYRNLYGISNDVPDNTVLQQMYSELHPAESHWHDELYKVIVETGEIIHGVVEFVEDGTNMATPPLVGTKEIFDCMLNAPLDPSCGTHEEGADVYY